MTEKNERNKLMEPILQYIIKSKISLQPEETKANSAILQALIEKQILEKLKSNNQTFKNIYQNLFYGGSYYDGLKVGKPEEYDWDLVFSPGKNCVLKEIPDLPGFVTIETQNRELQEFVTNNFLSTKKLLTWMEGLVTKTLKEFPQSGTQHILMINDEKYLVKITKSGPAFTLHVYGENNGQIKNFDVDLVPCFKFGLESWPKGNFRQNNVNKKPDFLVVPKPVKNCPKEYENIAWRLSFQEQEQQLIKGLEKFKPALKLMKCLRDKMQQNSISSYFLKTLFLWELESKNISFSESSLSKVFMEMLEVYQQALENNKIPYYWNKNNNLIAAIPEKVLENYSNRLKNIITKIKKQEDQYFVATLFLDTEEIETMKEKLPPIKPKQSKCCDVIQIPGDNGTNIRANIGNININASLSEDFIELKKIVLNMNNENERNSMLLEKLTAKVDVLNERNSILLEKLMEKVDKLTDELNEIKELAKNRQNNVNLVLD